MRNTNGGRLCRSANAKDIERGQGRAAACRAYGRTCSALHSRAFGAQGQALAEFALILFVLMLLVMGIVDLGRAVYVQSTLANAAREGARAAIVEPTEQAVAAAQTAVAELAQAGAVQLGATPLVTVRDEYVQVVVTSTFHPLTGLIAEATGIGPGGIELRGSSKMRRE